MEISGNFDRHFDKKKTKKKTPYLTCYHLRISETAVNLENNQAE